MKVQDPSPKIQVLVTRGVGAFDLELLWSLVLGAWCFPGAWCCATHSA